MGTTWKWETIDDGDGRQTLVDGVNFTSLPKGQWLDHYWSTAQTSRCSNNCPMPLWEFWQTHPFKLTWQVHSTETLSKIFFSVSADQPGSDLRLWTDLRNGSVVTGVGWQPNLNASGLYICDVRGATKPFSIVAG